MDKLFSNFFYNIVLRDKEINLNNFIVVTMIGGVPQIENPSRIVPEPKQFRQQCCKTKEK